MANRQYIQSTHTANLPIPNLPLEARRTHIFPELHSSLLAVAPLCDSGCQVTFNKHGCTIQMPDNTEIHCPRDPQGLWTLPPNVFQQANMTQTSTRGTREIEATRPPLTTERTDRATQPHTAEPTQVERPAINRHTNTPADLVAFAHAALFSPALATLKTALRKGFLPPFTGLNETMLNRFPPSLEATAMGHMDAQRKNTWSTKHTQPATQQEDTLDHFPPQPINTTRMNACFIATAEPRNIVYSDQTGRLPHPSCTGNNYLVVAYDYNSNSILLRPIKSRAAGNIANAIADIHRTLARGGCKPQFHRLDNECSDELKQFFDQHNIHYQLAPPHEHQSNAAERAIRTAKNHLAAGWWSMDPNFPMHLWDRTIPQAELTLNLLRQSRLNPNLSAWEQIHGCYDFNSHPIAPPCI